MKTNPLALAVSNFAGLDDWFPVFKTGEHTDSAGRKVNFTTTDLDSIIANHTADDPAPFVFGHPKHNDPAYGWTADLKRDGELLLAKGKDIVSEFSEAVKNKLFPNRSISILPDGSGGYKLQHIGFLGAKRPAIAGLGNISFSSADNALEFSMSTEDQYSVSYGFSTIARMLRAFREWIITEKDIETADRIMPDWEIESVTRAASDVRPQDKNNFTANEDDPVDPKKEFSQADIDAAIQAALTDERNKSTTEIQKLQFAAAKGEAERLIDGLKTEGKLLPAQCEGLAEFMASLPSDAETAFEFAAGEEGATVKKTPREFMTGLLKGLGKQIVLGKDNTEGPDADETVSNFNAPAGATVSPERAELDKKARKYMAAHNTDYITAVTAVERGE